MIDLSLVVGSGCCWVTGGKVFSALYLGGLFDSGCVDPKKRKLELQFKIFSFFAQCVGCEIYWVGGCIFSKM